MFLQLGPLVDRPLQQCRMRCKAGGFSTGAALSIAFGAKHAAQKATRENIYWYLRFCLFWLSPLKRRSIRWRNSARRRVQTITGFYTFMSKGVIYQNMTYFTKTPACRPTASQQWRVGRLVAVARAKCLEWYNVSLTPRTQSCVNNSYQS